MAQVIILVTRAGRKKIDSSTAQDIVYFVELNSQHFLHTTTLVGTELHYK